MKYFDISTVVNSYQGFQNCMTNKSWGYLALLKGCNNYIHPSVSYEVDMNVVSNFLEGIFNLSSNKRQYRDGRSLFVVFSNVWDNYFIDQGQFSPNIFDIAAWAYRRKAFNDNTTEDDIIKEFTQEFHIPTSVIERCFDTKKKHIIFANALYSEPELKSELSKIGVDTSRDNIDSKKSSSVASPGEISRGPFVQTLYAGLDITEYVLILQSNYDSLYGPLAGNGSEKGVSASYSNSLQQIFYGAPGTGKSHEIKEMTEGKAVVRVTFHPDSDYSTFVGCYKPNMKENVISKNGVETKEEQIVYRFVPQAFTKAYTAAWNTEKEVYLVIEEINRGNCAQIFGDLFQLLDRGNDGRSEYPIDADSDLADHIAKELTYSPRTDFPEGVKEGKKLVLPENLYIWATMNTSDQSLFPIDSAFKRRWDWKYLPIENAGKEWKIMVNNHRYDWYRFLNRINKEVYTLTHSEDKQLGYFFAKAKDGIIDAKTLVNKVYFYLWNDVFKDYDYESQKAFRNPNKNKPIAFKDFFKSGEELDEMMAEQILLNLELDKPEESAE